MIDFGETLKKDLSPEEFQRFRDWIHKHSGIYLEDSKMDSLRISLVTRATRFNYVDYGEYFELLSRDENEFKELMNLVTINETSFFRFPAQFDALRDKVIPEILETKSKVSRSFRVWSAGCSTGEEPYTIAMTLLDSGLEGLGYRCEVFGTDVSTQALDRAHEAIYPPKSVTNLPQNVVQRWFEPVRGGHRPVRHQHRRGEHSAALLHPPGRIDDGADPAGRVRRILVVERAQQVGQSRPHRARCSPAPAPAPVPLAPRVPRQAGRCAR